VIENALSHERQGIRAVYILAEYAAERKNWHGRWRHIIQTQTMPADQRFNNHSQKNWLPRRSSKHQSAARRRWTTRK